MLFIEQLMSLSICYPSRNARSSQKRRRREAVNGCGVITRGTDQQVPVLQLESLAPTLSAKGAEKGGAPCSCEGVVAGDSLVVGLSGHLRAGGNFLIFVLQLIKLEINAVLGQELLVGAHLADLAFVHHDDFVGALDG